MQPVMMPGAAVRSDDGGERRASFGDAEAESAASRTAVRAPMRSISSVVRVMMGTMMMASATPSENEQKSGFWRSDHEPA